MSGSQKFIAEVVEDLEALGEISPEVVVEMCRTLNSGQQSLAVENDIRAAAIGILHDSRLAEAVTRVITAFHYSLSRLPSEQNQNTLIEELLSELKKVRPRDDGFLESLNRSLSSISELRSIRLTFKARDLLLEQERLLVDSRIITDVRPVFDDNSSLTYSAALILQTLRIAYEDSQGTNEFFVALNEKNLSDLRDAVDRALQKAQSMKTVLQASNTRILPSGGRE